MKTYSLLQLLLAGSLSALLPAANASVAPDTTRVVFDGRAKATNVSLRNDNKESPYLAQSWVENIAGEKVNSPLMVVPPILRIEPASKSVVTVRKTGTLPEDRESLFFYNVREIPPKAKGGSSLQIALQSRLKLFYRPAALASQAKNSPTPWQEKMTLVREGGRWTAKNPTPYYIVLTGVKAATGGNNIGGFTNSNLAPLADTPLSLAADTLPASVVLSYINDYGGDVEMNFQCKGNQCAIKS